LTPKPKVAVFILNYNSSNFKSTVYRSIESALSINYPLLDIVIIDNASSDRSFEAIKDRFGKDVIQIRFEHNYGYSGGNELGFERYKDERGFPDYAIFMNNDFTVTNKDYVKDLVNFLEHNEDVVLAQGFNLAGDGVHVDSAGYFVDANLSVVGRFSGQKLTDCPQKSSYVTYVSGSCFISKVKVIREVRGYFFEPKLFAYWDESELAFNMWSYGLKSIFIPTTVGIHYTSKSFGNLPVLTEYLLIRNRYALRRHYLNGMIKILSTPTFLTISLLYRPLQGLKGRVITRAFVDAYLQHVCTSSTVGLYNPLIVVPKSLSYAACSSFIPKRFRKKTLGRISNLTVSDDDFRASVRPFAVTADF
jgi:GT2 family glycosyltransferase